MKINYKHTTVILGVIVIALMVSFTAVLAGNINSSAAPNATNSYTLADIYNRLNAGTAGTQSTFAEPTGDPGSTMADLNTIMAAAPAVDDTNGAIAADVANGKTFWGLKSGGDWGQQTGTFTSAPCDCAGGTLNGTRWCDNGDDTVTDLLGGPADSNDPTIVGQCLEWAKDPSWGDRKPWIAYSGYDDAHSRASAYGSETDNWRLPTRAELYALAHGTEAVSLSNGRAFTGIGFDHWSSTSSGSISSDAWGVYLSTGVAFAIDKGYATFVWPVRGGQ